MKKIILLLCAFIVSCNQEPTEIKNPIKGVWELEGFIRYEIMYQKTQLVGVILQLQDSNLKFLLIII